MRIPKSRGALMLVTAIVAPAAVACTQRINPDWLWLPSNATTEITATSFGRRRTTYRDRSVDVAFTVANLDQRENLSRELIEHFEREGWRRRETEYLNPGVATSFATGWRRGGGGVRVTDAQGRPRTVFVWRGEWENEPGDIIFYALQATGAWNEQQGRSVDDYVRGYAAIVPQAVVAASQRHPPRPKP